MSEKPNILKVKAGEGRTVMIPAADNPTGGAFALVEKATDEQKEAGYVDGEVDVIESTSTRRRIRGGDLIVTSGKTAAQFVDTSIPKAHKAEPEKKAKPDTQPAK